MDEMTEIFPQLLVQFEDFSTDNAFRYLDLFRNQYRVFNDDVSPLFAPSPNSVRMMNVNGRPL